MFLCVALETHTFVSERVAALPFPSGRSCVNGMSDFFKRLKSIVGANLRQRGG